MRPSLKLVVGVLLVVGGVGVAAWGLLQLLRGGLEADEPMLAALGALAAFVGAVVGGRLMHEAWQGRTAS